MYQYSKLADQEKYPFILPKLPFAQEDFAPHFSVESFEYHHGKHHNAYVTNLNKLLEANSELAAKNLEAIITASHGKDNAIFNNAAQVWNHSFFWHSIKPGGGGRPKGEMLAAVLESFGSYEKFLEQFKQAAVTQFGSGWAWLVYDAGRLVIMKTANAETPISSGVIPIIACDVWEHAYYIDYRNKRPDYVAVFLDHMINWDFALTNLTNARLK